MRMKIIKVIEEFTGSIAGQIKQKTNLSGDQSIFAFDRISFHGGQSGFLFPLLSPSFCQAPIPHQSMASKRKGKEGECNKLILYIA